MTRAGVGAPSPLPPAAQWPALGAALAVIGLGLAPPPTAAQAPPIADFLPVTDAVLQAPAPEDWLMWRRTLDAWGYSPLDQIDRSNVGDLRLVWTRALTPGSQQGTPLAYGGVLYMPNPGDVIQAIDAATGDLVWEHRRDLPEDIYDHVGRLAVTNRNLAILRPADHRHERRQLRVRPPRGARRRWALLAFQVPMLASAGLSAALGDQGANRPGTLLNWERPGHPPDIQ